MKITGIGRGLPRQTVMNEQLERILDTSDEWIQSRTGIRERRVLGEDTLTELALAAGREALADAGVSGADLDLILVATTMGDYIFPALSCLIQQDLGAGCPAMDLHAACTGFLYALQTADAFLQAGKARRVLVVGAESITRLADWEDRATCVLFGDGAGAVVVEPGEGLLSMRLNAQTDARVLYMLAEPGNCPFTTHPEEKAGGLKMLGQDVFRFAVTACARDLEAAVSEAGVRMQDVDWFLLHQANRRILDTVRQRLGIDPVKMPSNIHRTGNTSAASIPLLLWELYHSGRLQKGQLLALSAFGAGLTSGACVIRWDRDAPERLVPAEDLFPQ
ncbi:MAG: ketoacyl-ACP synthase III [Clostridiales bacterium]|nr:ketoacyl-ACP synthase III [Clostridiales bacterium]